MLTQDEIEALHEAGHVVADIFYDLHFVAVYLDHEKGPHVKGEKYYKPINPAAPTDDEMDWITRTAKATYAARWAEIIAFGPTHKPGDKGDHSNCARFAEDYIPDAAERPGWLSEQFYASQDDVTKLMKAIRAVADELIIKRTMTYAEVKAVYNANYP